MLNWYQLLNDFDECVTSTVPVHEPPFSISQVWWRSGAFSTCLSLAQHILLADGAETWHTRWGHTSKMEGFCSFLVSVSGCFSQLGDKYYLRKSEVHMKRNLLRQQLYSCVQMFRFPHIRWQVTYTEIIKGYETYLGCMHAILSSLCAHNSEQLAACKGSRKTTLTIFTWWRMWVCQFQVSTATKPSGEELYLVQLQQKLKWLM